MGSKNTIPNIYRIQACDSTILWTDFIEFMLKDKSLLDYSNLFFPHDYENNEKIIQKYLQ